MLQKRQRFSQVKTRQLTNFHIQTCKQGRRRLRLHCRLCHGLKLTYIINGRGRRCLEVSTRSLGKVLMTVCKRGRQELGKRCRL